MERQLEQSAKDLEDWARGSAEPGSDVARWYQGEGFPLPHPEWGAADTIYHAILRSEQPLDIKAKLLEGISQALGELVEKKDWSAIEHSAVVEMLLSCRDLGPHPDVMSCIQRVMDHERATNDLEMIEALRQALIYNQDDESLKGVWLDLLAGKDFLCLSPAPLSDIRGVCRLGGNDSPAIATIAEGIGLFAKTVENELNRRPILHAVWEDLAQVWNRNRLDPAWNWELIEAGRSADWPTWVFETLPCLYGRFRFQR